MVREKNFQMSPILAHSISLFPADAFGRMLTALNDSAEKNLDSLPAVEFVDKYRGDPRADIRERAPLFLLGHKLSQFRYGCAGVEPQITFPNGVRKGFLSKASAQESPPLTFYLALDWAFKNRQEVTVIGGTASVLSAKSALPMLDVGEMSEKEAGLNSSKSETTRVPFIRINPSTPIATQWYAAHRDFLRKVVCPPFATALSWPLRVVKKINEDQLVLEDDFK